MLSKLIRWSVCSLPGLNEYSGSENEIKHLYQGLCYITFEMSYIIHTFSKGILQ